MKCFSNEQKEIIGKLLERETGRISEEVAETKKRIKGAKDGIVDLTDYPAAEKRAKETGEPMYVMKFGVDSFEWFVQTSEAKLKVYREVLKEINETPSC